MARTLITRWILPLALALLAPALPGSSAAPALDTPPGAPPAIDGDWLATVSATIGASEYHLSASTDGGAWTAPNRAHDLRARWLADGTLSLEARTIPGDWSLRYRLRGVGRGWSLTPTGPVRGERVVDGRLEWTRAGVDEWYRNGARGLEQGFTIHARPQGAPDEPVVLEGELAGLLAYPTEDAQAVLLRDGRGVEVLRVGELRVSDARGVGLPACFEVAPGVLRILVNDREAVYPLAIDPLMTSAVWTVKGSTNGSRFGQAVAAAGDVNGDGYGDVIVGAHQYDNGEPGEGRAFVYLGSSSGLATSASWTAESNQAGAGFGWSVGTAGDVNADGYGDVIVGAYLYTDGETHEGRAYVYHGSAAGLATSAAWTAESNQTEARFGSTVGTAGDVNGDGYTDVVVGAPQYGNGEAGEGRAYVYHGSAAGLGATAAWTGEANQQDAAFGAAVATAGDVNGDGYADVVVGAPKYDNGQVDEGAAFLYRGSGTGLAATPAWIADSNQASAGFGGAVGTAGDVNGDGYADVIVGASGYDNGQTDEGRAYVYHGSASGLVQQPAWTAEGDQNGASFGWSVGTAGDVNGDGYADVIVGAYGYDNGQTDEGRAVVYQGSKTGLAAQPRWSAEGDVQGASFGWSVGTAGDVNGDGYSDVITGAPLYPEGPQLVGLASVHLGAGAPTATDAWSTMAAGVSNAGLGESVSLAGDVNGDGFSDFLAGGRGTQWLVFGGTSSMLSQVPLAGGANPAGDVNGDGYSDVFVAGKLYLGSKLGLGTSPVWNPAGLAAGDLNGDGYGDFFVTYSQNPRVEVYLGAPALPSAPVATLKPSPTWPNPVHAVAAGDVNGDGYGDLLFLAEQVYLYLGSATGLSGSPAATLPGASAGVGDVNGDGYADLAGPRVLYLGSSALPTPVSWSVPPEASKFAAAGDVNGDGYGDVLVGAPSWENGEQAEGAAWVYLGSASGLSGSPAWQSPESNIPGTYVGLSVAGVGDVNGDGFADVLVGAPGYSDFGKLYSGRTFLFLGNGGPGLERRPRQGRSSSEPLSLLGGVYPSQGIWLLAQGRTPFGRAPVRLEWELKSLATPFDGTSRSTAWQDSGAPGTKGSVVALMGQQVPLDVSSGPLKWRLRVRARTPLPWQSPWLSVPGNAPTETDARALGLVSIGDAARVEGNCGNSELVFEVSVPWPPDPGVTWKVAYRTQDGSAQAGSDYQAMSGTLSFVNGGATTQYVPVPILGDLSAEPDETFRVVLSDPVNPASGLIQRAVGTGTIRNDDDSATDFVWHAWFAVDTRETPYVGDFNGDGMDDIITFTRDNPLSFGDVYVALSTGTAFGVNQKWNDWFAISPDEVVVIGDYDGDGRDDIATWLKGSTWQVYVARSLGTGMDVAQVWRDRIGSDPADVLLAGDANGDGRDDLILFARSRGTVRVALSMGTGFQAATEWHSFFAVSSYERPAMGDLNGDGKVDILTFATDSPTAYGDVYVALSTGSQFEDGMGSRKWHDFFSIDPAQLIRLGDIDGDGKADVFTFMPRPSSQVYTAQSHGTYLGPNVLVDIPGLTRAATDIPYVADADGDGRADIVVFHREEHVVRVHRALCTVRPPDSGLAPMAFPPEWLVRPGLTAGDQAAAGGRARRR